MLKETIRQEGTNPLVMKESVYESDKIKDKSAKRKEAICSLITEGSQLTLLATIIEQMGDKIGLDTPEFKDQFKPTLDKIRSILNG